MTDINPLDLVFASEAARIIGVSEQTLKTWERLGRLVPRRIGNVRVFRRAEVERLADERAAVVSVSRAFKMIATGVAVAPGDDSDHG